MTSIMMEFGVEEQDVEHIERLQELQDTGAEMDLLKDLGPALLAHFGNPEAAETLEWVTERIQFYSSTIWDVDGLLEGDFPKVVTRNFGQYPDEE